MNDKPIMRDPMDSEEAKEMQLRYIKIYRDDLSENVLYRFS